MLVGYHTVVLSATDQVWESYGLDIRGILLRFLAEIRDLPLFFF